MIRENLAASKRSMPSKEGGVDGNSAGRDPALSTAVGLPLVAPKPATSGQAGVSSACPGHPVGPTEIFPRDEEARRRRCRSASARSDDDVSGEEIGGTTGVIQGQAGL